MEALSLCQSYDVQLNLARNTQAALEGGPLVRLLRAARARWTQDDDGQLAEALLRRRPLRPEHAVLFLYANPGQRLEILLAAQRAELGRRFEIPRSADAVGRLEAAAIIGDGAKLVTELAAALECSLELAKQIVHDASGEPLAIALAALGTPNDVLIRVLVSTDLGSGDYPRIRTLARLSSALSVNAAASVLAGIVDDHTHSVRNWPRTDHESRRAVPGSEGRRSRSSLVREPRSPTSFVA